MPTLSIIIATYNRDEVLHRTVKQMLVQNFRDFELWVIDQSDPDVKELNAARIAAFSDQRVHHVDLATRGVANARNEGVARANGQFILFVDDDVVILEDDFLDTHLRAYEDSSIGGVTGRTIERILEPNAQRTVNRVSVTGRIVTNLSGQERVYLDTLKGANMSYRAVVFAEVGGFDRNYNVGTALLEEADHSSRVVAAGWKLLFEPRAELLHLSCPSGGVRVANDEREFYWRIRLTTYFMLIHRSPMSLPLFLFTFAAIAVHRAMLWKSLEPLRHFIPAVRDGHRMWKRGSDTEIRWKTQT